MAAWDDQPRDNPSDEPAYTGEPTWSRVHFPFISLYTAAIQAAGGFTRPFGDEDRIKAVAEALRTYGYQSSDEGARRQFIAEALRDGREFRDRETVKRYAQSRLQTAAMVDEAVSRLEQSYRSPDAGRRVRLVIARLVEQRFGASARAEYFVAMFTGKVP